jgi:hypothetical protein
MATTMLSATQSALKTIITPLSLEDRHVAEDISNIMLMNSADKEYEVEGLTESSEYKPGFQLKVSETSNIYTLIILNRPAVSMRALIKLFKHESVHDVTVENEPAPNRMTVRIEIFKVSTTEVKQNKIWKPNHQLIVDNNINGLIISKASRQDAKEIISRVINMEDADMLEPLWENRESVDGMSYLLIASPIRRMSLSFYKHMLDSFPNILKNIILTPNLLEGGNLTCMRMTIHCNINNNNKNQMDTDDDSDSDDVYNKKKNHHQGVDRLRMNSKLPITKKKQGFWSFIKNSVF